MKNLTIRSAVGAGLAAMATLLSAGSAQAASQIVNGGFESASVNPGGGFTTLGGGSGAIDGWTVGGHSVDYIGTYWQAKDGVRSVDLSGGNAGSVSQTIGTAIGEAVTVSFWLAGNPDGGDSMKLIITSATGGPAQQDIFTTVLGAGTRANMNWQQFFYSFTASAASTTLTFESGEANAFGPALDLVSIVPEPASWAMMIAGFGAVGAALRRRPARALRTA